MDFELFWDKYINEKMTDLTDMVFEVFSQDLALEIHEEYDLSELVLEFIGHHETAKQYDKIEVFADLLKVKHTALYKENLDYICHALVPYYCYLRDASKLRAIINDTLAQAYDLDLFFESLKHILYYQYFQIANEFILREYENIKLSPDIIDGAGYELSMIKFYIEAEQGYLKQREAGLEEWEAFIKLMNSQFDFNLTSDSIQYFLDGLFSQDTTELEQLFSKHTIKDKPLHTYLEGAFIKEMLLKNIPFPISRNIFQHLLDYLREENQAKRPKSLFYFRDKSFTSYLNSVGNFFSDNTDTKALIIWGASYFNDFLFQQTLISSEQFQKNRAVISKQKEHFREAYKSALWQATFIYEWQPSNDILEEEWQKEKAHFTASFHVEPELIEPDPFLIPTDDFSKPTLDNSFIPELKQSKRIELKYGRNEKITVQYLDGTIKKDIKYKKVMHDLERGSCKVVE